MSSKKTSEMVAYDWRTKKKNEATAAIANEGKQSLICVYITETVNNDAYVDRQ